MSAQLNGVGAGVGQPQRPDFQGELHQARLTPGIALDVPKSGLKTSTQLDKNPGSDPFERQFNVLHGQGEVRDNKTDDWSKFSAGGRRGKTKGASDEVGQIRTPVQGKKKKEQPKQPGKNWAQNAAELEEWARDHGSSVGTQAQLDLPSGDTSPKSPVQRKPGGNKARRLFQLKG